MINLILILKMIFAMLLILFIFDEWKKEKLIKNCKIEFEERKNGIKVSILIFLSIFLAPIPIFSIFISCALFLIYILIFYFFILRKKKFVYKSNKNYICFYFIFPMVIFILSYFIGLYISLKEKSIVIILLTMQIILSSILISLFTYILLNILKWIIKTLKYKVKKIDKNNREEIKPISVIPFMFLTILVLILM